MQRILKYRWVWIILSAGLTLALGYQIRNLKFETDITKFLPEENPKVKFYREIGEKFGGNYMGLIIIEADDIFKKEVIDMIRKLVKEIKLVQGISNVMSIVNMMDIKRIPGGIEVSDLIGEGEISQDSLYKIRDYVLSKEMYRGKVVSPDCRYTAIICQFSEHADKISVARKIMNIAKKYEKGYKFYYTGTPFAMIQVKKLIIKDLRILILLVIMIIPLILFLCFRSIRGVLLPLLSSALSVIWVFGLMSIFKRPVTMASDTVPVLLIAIGTAYGIHLINRYDEDKNVLIALKEVFLPVLLAALTTFIGFMSFLTSDLKIIRDFGMFTGLGVLFSFLLTITLLPSILSFTRPAESKELSFRLLLNKIYDFVSKRSKVISLTALIVSIVAIAGIPRIHTETNLEEYLPKGCELRKGIDLVRDKFGGAVPVDIYFKGDILNPYTLYKMKQAEWFMRQVKGLHNPNSIASILCEMNYKMNGRYTLPESKLEAENLLFFMSGRGELSQMLTSDKKEAIVSATTEALKTSDEIVIKEELDKFLRENKNFTPEYNIYLVLKGFDKEIDTLKLFTFLRKEKRNLKNPDFNMVKKFVKDYLTSEESEIYIEDEILINKISHALYNLMIKNNLSSDAIFNKLKRILKGYFEEDVQLLSESFSIRLAEFIKMYKVSQFMKDFGEIGINPDDDSQFYKELYCATWLYLFNIPEENDLLMEATGGPIVSLEVHKKLTRTQLISMFFTLFLTFLMTSYLLRSLKYGLLSLSAISISLLINFGLMGWANLGLNPITVFVASLAIGIGIDYTIHFIARMRQDGIRPAITGTGRAILFNALSVCAGFLTLLFAQLVPLRTFGLLIAITMITASLGAITVIPSLLNRQKT